MTINSQCQVADCDQPVIVRQKCIPEMDKEGTHARLFVEFREKSNHLDQFVIIKGLVLTVTGKATPELVATGQKLGLNNLIQKPFTTPSMRQCIESVVGRL